MAENVDQTKNSLNLKSPFVKKKKKRRCVTGYIPYMPTFMIVNTIAACLRTDRTVLGN